MKVLLIGSGGREHALAWKLVQSELVEELLVAPGNPGIAMLPKTLNVALDVDNHEEIVDYVKACGIGLVVVGPEAPLVAGLADVLRANNIPVFGPNKAAAELEGSKAFSKEMMAKYNIPTAFYKICEDVETAKAYVEEKGAPIVVKADGLAAGKGVVVAMTKEEALAAIDDMMGDMKFGAAGARVVIEEFMDGEEASLLAFTDGKTVVPMIASQDHKRVGDGDKGPNTGGMGTYAPAPVLTPELRQKAYETVLKPMVAAMAKEGKTYQGCLYAGLMVKGDSVKVVEFNCRFGDPETQVVLPLLDADLAEIMLACDNGTLDRVTINWHDRAAVCVVVASEGYPGSYAKGKEISGLDEAPENTVIFHAGTKEVDGKVVTAGGRVLGVTGFAADIRAAKDKAYEAVAKVKFEGAFCRKDIAWRALK